MALPVVTVRVGDLLIDRENYQRNLKASTLKQIQGNWDPFLGLPGLLVNRREEGVIAVIDGGHRIEAFKNDFGPDASLQVSMTYGLTLASEAWLYARLNGVRKAVTAGERVRSLITAEDEKAQAVLAVLETGGIPYSWHSGMVAAGKLTCWATVQDVYDRGGTPLLSQTLSLIQEAWPTEPRRFDGRVVLGVARFLQLYGAEEKFTEQEASRKLAMRTLMELRTDAAHHVSLGYGRDTAFAFALRDWYNSGRRSRRLAPMPASR